MEIINNYTKHIPAFETLLISKGYRAMFQLDSNVASRKDQQGILKECLHGYLYDLHTAGITREDFTLRTYAEYLSADDLKECLFSGSFDLQEGIRLHRLIVTSKHPDETQRFSFRNNQEIPGKNAVIGKFRKPKHLDRMTRGDFRFRKKW